MLVQLVWVASLTLSKFIYLQSVMKKIIFSILLTLSSIGMIFAIEVKLPKDNSEDLSINHKRNVWKVLGWDTKLSTEHNSSINSSEGGSDKTIFSIINFINKNLWRSFSVIAMWLTAYAWYEAITSWGDTKTLKKAMRIFIWVAVWLTIAMLSSALVRIVVNLI